MKDIIPTAESKTFSGKFIKIQETGSLLSIPSALRISVQRQADVDEIIIDAFQRGPKISSTRRLSRAVRVSHCMVWRTRVIFTRNDQFSIYTQKTVYADWWSANRTRTVTTTERYQSQFNGGMQLSAQDVNVWCGLIENRTIPWTLNF